jgi:2-phosphoglycerate kinase
MLYLIGGTSRSGKTTLAGLLLRRHHVPFLSLDVLKMALHQVMPTEFPGPYHPHRHLGEAIRPVIHAVGIHAVAQGLEYCLEGDLLIPKDVTELSQLHPGQVRACFLGYPTILTLEKLDLIERFPGRLNDWANRDLDRAGKIAHIERMRRRGRELALSCREEGVPFIDTSQAFESSLEQAYRQLTV